LKDNIYGVIVYSRVRVCLFYCTSCILALWVRNTHTHSRSQHFNYAFTLQARSFIATFVITGK